MSIFLDYKVELPPKEQYTCTAWSCTETILAVAFKSQQILFYQEEGKRFGSAIHGRKADVIAMEWQPTGNVLAVGWSDGTISLWNAKTLTAKEFRSPYAAKESAIIFLRWSPYGNRLIATDREGLLSVLKIDVRGNASICAQYRRKGQLRHCVFCTSVRQRERQLKNESSFSQNACPAFFFGGDAGVVHYADDLGHSSDIQHLNSSIESMLFYEEKSRLIIITQSLMLVQLQVTEEGDVRPIMKVKLSIASEATLSDVLWAGPGLMATASNEPLIRLWDFAEDQNYVLSIASTNLSGVHRADRITSIRFNPRRRILSAGTKDGLVLFWRFSSPQGRAAGVASWQALSYVTLAGRNNIQSLTCGQERIADFTTVAFTEGLVILSPTSIHHSMCQDVALLQTSPTCLSVETFAGGKTSQALIETSSLRIKGAVSDGKLVMVHNGSRAELYELPQGEEESRTSSSIKLVGEVMCDAGAVPLGLSQDTFYRIVDFRVEGCNFRGKIKTSVSFTECEGRPIVLDVTTSFLVVGTDKGTIKVFDISRREPKLVGQPGKLFIATSKLNAKHPMILRSIACNVDGTYVSCLLDSLEGALGLRTPASQVVVYSGEHSTFSSFDFGLGRYPQSHFWDQVEPRILVCESFHDVIVSEHVGNTQSSLPNNNHDRPALEKALPTTAEKTQKSEREITSFFAVSEEGIRMQDTFELEEKYTALVGVHVPYLFLSAKTDHVDPDQPSPMLRSKVMRDFVGLDKVDADAKKALVNFSYYITVGNMDEAYRSVKLIENATVWENMAHMCVKTKRLDVAQVCLGNMKHARGARAVRLTSEPEVEAKMATVAIELGLLDDAIKLYTECGRYDLLNTLYQAAGRWTAALDVASTFDRIHLKNTHFRYAQHLEHQGQLDLATAQYELAGLAHVHVPRMLYAHERLPELEDYIRVSKDPRLYLWYGKFLESRHELDKAVKFYKKGRDYLAIVRVYCAQGELERAAEVVAATKSKLAAYHLAREFEAQNCYPVAIRYYAEAEVYVNALRLAKAQHLDGELMAFALLSPKVHMLDTALYFEQQGEVHKAVQLYEKGGNVQQAISVCIQHSLVHELVHLAEGCHDSSQVSQCADYLYASGEYASAVTCFIRATRFEEALNVCMNHDVHIREDMAEDMTLVKRDNDDDEGHNARRLSLLQKLAKACRHQGSYHLATKKYTQAGDKVKAMKCLLKSGDTDKVIFFAGVSRHRDIYVLAANYLQNLDWQVDAEILKHITGFYQKARAYGRLGRFHEAQARAQVEDGGRDNYVAQSKLALVAATKALGKSKEPEDQETLVRLTRRLELVEEYLSLESSPTSERMVKLEHMLSIHHETQNELDVALRLGDILGPLIEHYYDQDELDRALTLFREFTQRVPGRAEEYIQITVVKSMHELMRQHQQAQPQEAKDGDDKGPVKGRHESEEEDDGIDEDIDWDANNNSMQEESMEFKD